MCETAVIPDWLAAMVTQARDGDQTRGEAAGWPNSEYPTLALAVSDQVKGPFAPDDGLVALIQMLINEVERLKSGTGDAEIRQACEPHFQRLCGILGIKSDAELVEAACEEIERLRRQMGEGTEEIR